MSECETYIEDIDAGYTEAQAHWQHLKNIVDWMDEWGLVATEDNWRTNVIGALRHSEGALSALIYGNEFPTGSYRVPYYLRECTGADELTWKAICEAWVKDDFEGRFWTIGIIDRMRQIMWDEPFDLTWAARPEQREM